MINPAFRKNLGLAFGLLLLLSVARAAAPQEHAQSAHHGFQDTAHWAAVFESPARAEWQKPDQVVRALNLKPGQTIIDIGAGTGYFTRRFALAVGPSGKAIGLDIEPGMVAYMETDARKLRLSNYEARLVKTDDPELAPDSVDIVFFCDVMHHIDGRVAYLKKLGPALKPGGRVAVVDFKDTSPIGPPPTIKIPRDRMIALFKQAGYRLADEHNLLPYQYFLEFAPAPPAR